ncbi:hypothetical protein LSCM4_08165 [Leishmania orientalis]|uniref:Uncharacterized protein n=1 Tax=Leishmania orientalis TaxID=2249476 RepID=A0A836I172_9TRYP|nr:hypothetical protein LSCM4_08165 [Leishmania orientalis]
MQNRSGRLFDSMYSLDADVLAFPLVGAVAAQLAAITALQMRTTSPLVDIGSANSPTASESITPDGSRSRPHLPLSSHWHPQSERRCGSANPLTARSNSSPISASVDGRGCPQWRGRRWLPTRHLGFLSLRHCRSLAPISLS